MQVHCLTFNAFQENTYVLADETGEAIIIDPGCSTPAEEQVLVSLLSQHSLKPVAIVNTHCHIDHIFGITAVREQYDIPFWCHEVEIKVMNASINYAPLYGVKLDPIGLPEKTLTEQDTIKFGNTTLEIRFTPGHSPASLCFIDHKSKQILAGDVLFAGSIGRTDLPGGDYTTLMESITKQLLSLSDEYQVYPGHGPMTTIGEERATNPFILEYVQ